MALATAIHLINRSPNKKLEFKVTEEIWSGKPPSYKHLKVFGCEVFFHFLKEFHDNLAPKSIKYIFLGYGKPSKMRSRPWYLEGTRIFFAIITCISIKKRCIRDLLK